MSFLLYDMLGFFTTHNVAICADKTGSRVTDESRVIDKARATDGTGSEAIDKETDLPPEIKKWVDARKNV